LAETQYWFARYRPGLPQNASRGLIPLNWKGRAAIAAFALGIVGGGVLFLIFGLRDQFAIGIPLFVVLAIAGGSFFLWASVARTDPSKSAYDYLAERGK
jgi:hypothetical protein